MRIARILLVATILLAIPAASPASVFISVNFAPPVLPVYVQPPCPAPGYMWTPGYWAYGPAGYYWVPGVWVGPPAVGFLWTPGYWGYGGRLYVWHPGYWGPHVGFYGGINYGFGYTGAGFMGGYWHSGAFFYNRAVENVSVTNIHNTYFSRTVVNRTVIYNRSSFNGPGGIRALPTPQERVAMSERHVAPTMSQVTHQRRASADRYQFASFNHGRPVTTAMNTVNGRRYNQQGRIANGVRSGQLTPRETQNIQGRESGLNHTIQSERRAGGGRLTPQQRQQIRRRQNNLSRSIYNDRHNGAVSRYGNNGVGRAHRGKPTPQERRNINRRQNGASRQVYHQKHKGKGVPQNSGRNFR